MKKIVASVLILAMLAGCGEPRSITTADGKTREYPTYGFFNQDTSKSDQICYKVSVGNVVWSIIGIENVVMPVYFIGFSLFNPTYAKPANGKCGLDAQ